jgi:Flp pilus assembly protein TadG
MTNFLISGPCRSGTCVRGIGQLTAVAVSPAKPIYSLQAQKLKSLTGGGRNKRQGAAAVEFALIAPLLVTLILGMIEFGRLMMVEQVLTNAAREGCRTAVVIGGSTSNATSAVATYLNGSGISGQTVTVSPDPSAALNGDPITVTISVPFSSVSWLASPFWLGGKTLTATVIMRKEPVFNNQYQS